MRKEAKMTAAATAASVAAISSLAAYINAKYHIGQDLRMLKFKKGAEKHYAELGTSVQNSMSFSLDASGSVLRMLFNWLPS